MRTVLFNSGPRKALRNMRAGLLLLGLLITIVSCTLTGSGVDTQQQKSIFPFSCTPPLEPFAYNYDNGPSQPQTLPGFPWEEISSLINLPEYAVIPIYEIQLTRAVGDADEIWIQRNWIERKDEDKRVSDYVVYNTESDKWKVIPSQVENGGVYVDQIYEDRDGNLWGRNVVYVTSDVEKPTTILSKFDPVLERFIPQSQIETIPTHYSTGDSRSSGLDYPSEVLLGLDGANFLIFAHNDAIYEYNPSKQSTKELVKIPGIIALSPIVSPIGDIYLLNHFFDYSAVSYIERMDLYKLSWQSHEFVRVPIHLDVRGAFFLNIFIDKQERLWLDSVGWMESSDSPYGTWYQLQRSPLFTYSTRESGNDYRWRPARVIFQSSDNSLWFRHENGMFALDTIQGEWCWFTTYQSNIVEDSDNNLWMIADNKLYKLALNP